MVRSFRGSIWPSTYFLAALLIASALLPLPQDNAGSIWPSTYFLAALLIASALLPLPQDNAIAGMPSICAFHNVTSLPCPGCGLTRAWVSMAHGQFANAFVWHPLGPILFLSTLFYTFWSGWTALFRPAFPLPMKLQMRLIIAFALVMFIFWGLRLAGVFPLPGG